jgi:hypothetical protein
MGSIATITLAVRESDGTVRIRLRPAIPDARRERVDMIVVNAPPSFEDAVIGVEVEGQDGFLKVAGRRWAERVGKNKLKLVPRKGKSP